jgi:hypothetical protein
VRAKDIHEKKLKVDIDSKAADWQKAMVG